MQSEKGDEKGARIDLRGTCFSFRCLPKEQFIDSAAPGSLQRLFQMFEETDVLFGVEP